MEEQAKFEGWAIIELMGRQVTAGYVSEQVIENKPAANPCGFNRAARRVFMAVGFSQVCNV